MRYLVSHLGSFAAGSTLNQIHMPESPWPGTPQKIRYLPLLGGGELDDVLRPLRQTLGCLVGVGSRDGRLPAIAGIGSLSAMMMALWGLPSSWVKFITTLLFGGPTRVARPLVYPLKLNTPALSANVTVFARGIPGDPLALVGRRCGHIMVRVSPVRCLCRGGSGPRTVAASKAAGTSAAHSGWSARHSAERYRNDSRDGILSPVTTRFLFLILLTIAASGPRRRPSKRTAVCCPIPRIYGSPEFAAETFGPSRWVDDGAGYTTLEPAPAGKGQDVVRYDVARGTREVLVSGDAPGAARRRPPDRYRRYAWSPDQNRLLVFTNSRPVWRLNTRGDYWVLERATGGSASSAARRASRPRSCSRSSRLTARGWATCGRTICTWRTSPTGRITALTTDGSRTIINGTFDWVYEEELMNYTRWVALESRRRVDRVLAAQRRPGPRLRAHQQHRFAVLVHDSDSVSQGRRGQLGGADRRRAGRPAARPGGSQIAGRPAQPLPRADGVGGEHRRGRGSAPQPASEHARASCWATPAPGSASDAGRARLGVGGRGGRRSLARRRPATSPG